MPSTAPVPRERHWNLIRANRLQIHHQTKWVNPQCGAVDKSSVLFSPDLSSTVSRVKLPSDWTIIFFKCFASLKIKTFEQKNVLMKTL
jgi:hypothetical protein